MKKRMSWYWALPAVAGLALVMVAALLSSSSPGNPSVPGVRAADDEPTATFTPTVTATPNANCELNAVKDAAASTVPEGGQITYTIKVENNGSGSGSCTDLTVTDVIPADTDCVSATATDDAGLDIDIDGCDTSGTVTWDTNDNLDTDDQVTLQMVVKLTSGANEDDKINNEACATSSSDVGGDCDSARVTVTGATATPTTAPSATPFPTVPPVPTVPTVIVPVPTARALPTLSPPITGSGSTSGGGSGPLALGLGLVGACLLLVSGAALVKRPR
jgi:uncharacterized repeat protein (TIGR01451 family)